MPISKYLKILIGTKSIQVTSPEDLPVSIDYSLEDPENFQNKKSSESLSLRIPATLLNDVAGNTFRNPDVLDLTDGQVFRGNQPFSIDENGIEIMNGKAFLKSGSHDSSPKDYEYDLFGDNADWKVDLEEATFFEMLQHINFTFDKASVIASWSFDGTLESLPYVFAPVRYRSPMGGITTNSSNETIIDDKNMLPAYMKPAISKYFLLFWAFKSVGYRIQSDFMNTEFFRRQVMPWTWGNFLSSDGTRLDTHKFLAKSVSDAYYDSPNGGHDFIWDMKVTNDSTDGAFDNNNDYSYDTGAFEMKWEYKTPYYGALEATFSMNMFYQFHCTGNSAVAVYAQWYKNGVRFQGTNGTYTFKGNEIASHSSSLLGGTKAGNQEMFATTSISPGDIISLKIHLHTYESKVGTASATANILQFKLDYFKIPLGGTVDFGNYSGLKKYKILDYLRGVIDEFNLSINTDSINKVVIIEPTHTYSLDSSPIPAHPGYFINDHLDWNAKADLSKEWVMENYSDYERELTFKYKVDSNDGVLKKVQDRNVNVIAAGKYVFPSRFKSGKKDFENRFFGASMHYDVEQWKSITGIAPQLMCLVPENISNTSNSESANTFVPKSAYYKGLVSGVGGWRFDSTDYTTLPFMFSVNYKTGGENDPILSYSDEKIENGSGFVIGRGLLKRFFWQRLAILRNGQFYHTWFRLRNVDVVNVPHREYKSYKGHRWELIQIAGYRPLQEGSTACLIRKWHPISQEDFTNTFPSASAVLNNTNTDPLDIKYAPLKCLSTDIPTS